MLEILLPYTKYAPVGILTISILTLAWSIWSFSKKYTKDKEIKDTDLFIKIIFDNIIKENIYIPMINAHKQIIGLTAEDKIIVCLKNIQQQITTCNRYLLLFESVNKKDVNDLEIFLGNYEDSIFEQFKIVKANANSFYRLEKYVLYQLSLFMLLLINMLANISIKDIKNIKLCL